MLMSYLIFWEVSFIFDHLTHMIIIEYNICNKVILVKEISIEVFNQLCIDLSIVIIVKNLFTSLTESLIEHYDELFLLLISCNLFINQLSFIV